MPLSVLVLFTEGRPLGEENIFKSTSRFDLFIMTAMAKGLARSPFIFLWAKAHWLLPHVVLGWGFARREEGLSATDRKKKKQNTRERVMEVGRETPSGYPELKVSNVGQR